MVPTGKITAGTVVGLAGGLVADIANGALAQSARLRRVAVMRFIVGPESNTYKSISAVL